MPRLRVHSLAISLDGYVAGPDQGPDDGEGEPRLSDNLAHVRFSRESG